MSDLQISLIVIGAVLVFSTILFNWYQQRKHRSLTESAFKSRHEDVLLDDFKPEQKVDPLFDADEYDLEEPAIEESIEIIAPAQSAFVDSEIDYVTETRVKNPIGAEELAELFRRKFDFGKHVSVYGQNIESGCWEEPHAKPLYRHFKISLQLVDRSGPVSLAKLSEFRDMVTSVSMQIGAQEFCPDPEEALKHAVLLDKFCAEVDMLIGINVMSRGEETFAGTKIRALAEASGFTLEADGTFKYVDENGRHLFSLCNHEPAVFLPDGMRHLSTHGITFLLDVPRVARGKQEFDKMVAVAKNFSTTLGGVLVDDKRQLLNESGLDKIRTLLLDLGKKMEARGVAPGSERALRLFS